MATLELVEVCRDENNKAVVNLHGATLQSWIHEGVEMIFVSKNAVFNNKKAVRGGIPVVFPCFGAWELGPQHGFARISKWTHTSGPSKDSNGDVSATFTLTDSEDTRKMWNGNKFEVQYTVTVKGDSLTTDFAVKNLNESGDFEFTCLLHTYFSVPDISKTTVSGLGGLAYTDKTDQGLVKQETSDPKTVSGFTDSVYIKATKDHIITNVAGGKTICLKKSNFQDTVVWNPWAEKAKAMSDFGDDELAMCQVLVSSLLENVSLHPRHFRSSEISLSKGATDNRDLVSLGLFAYPVLMSADILLYKATHVPVGDDQLQHLELARDIAKSFNSHYGFTFPDPQPLLGNARRIMSLRNPLQKMSKSDNQELSRINLSDPPDRIRNTVRKAITDSVGEVSYDLTERPAVSNLVAIYAAVTGLSHEDVCTKYQGKQTVDFKDELAEVLIEKISPIQKKMMYLERNLEYVDKVLCEGAEKAKELANTNLNQVKQLLGLQ